MVTNPIINKKLKDKTSEDPIMKEFLDFVLENESKGKNFSEPFKKEIKKSVSKKGGASK